MTNSSQKKPQTQQDGTFDPHTAFLDLRIVRLTIGILLGTVLISSVTIVIHDHLALDLTSTGFNTAASIFKVPLGALTFAIPALALLAANHRSEQTKRQMSLTLTQIERTDRQIQIAQGQNNFSNYFKHLEEFNKRFKFDDDSTEMGVTNTHKLHAWLYPGARDGDLSVSTDVVREFQGNVESFLDACLRFREPTGWATNMHFVYSNMNELAEKFYLGFTSITGTMVQHNGSSFTLIGGKVALALEHYLSVFRYIDEILSFDPTYRSGPSVCRVLKATALSSSAGPGPFHPFDIEQVLPAPALVA
jgi:hypothetical protein